jgi:hypothetical protein
MTKKQFEDERDRIYKAFCGRDLMHLPLYEALQVVFTDQWKMQEELLAALEEVMYGTGTSIKWYDKTLPDRVEAIISKAKGAPK